MAWPGMLWAHPVMTVTQSGFGLMVSGSSAELPWALNTLPESLTPWQSIQNSFGCTPLFPSPKSVGLWGVHHRTSWRLVGVPF